MNCDSKPWVSHQLYPLGFTTAGCVRVLFPAGLTMHPLPLSNNQECLCKMADREILLLYWHGCSVPHIHFPHSIWSNAQNTQSEQKALEDHAVSQRKKFLKGSVIFTNLKDKRVARFDGPQCDSSLSANHTKPSHRASTARHHRDTRMSTIDLQTKRLTSL